MADYYSIYKSLEKTFRNDSRGLDLTHEFHNRSLDFFKCFLKMQSDYAKEEELLAKTKTSINNLNDYIRQSNTAIRPLPMLTNFKEITRFMQECYRQEGIT